MAFFLREPDATIEARNAVMVIQQLVLSDWFTTIRYQRLVHKLPSHISNLSWDFDYEQKSFFTCPYCRKQLFIVQNVFAILNWGFKCYVQFCSDVDLVIYNGFECNHKCSYKNISLPDCSWSFINTKYKRNICVLIFSISFLKAAWTTSGNGFQTYILSWL